MAWLVHEPLNCFACRTILCGVKSLQLQQCSSAGKGHWADTASPDISGEADRLLMCFFTQT